MVLELKYSSYIHTRAWFEMTAKRVFSPYAADGQFCGVLLRWNFQKCQNKFLKMWEIVGARDCVALE